VARPTKKTDETVGEILRMLESGCTFAAACATAGIHVDTLLLWRQQDAKLSEQVDKALGKARARAELLVAKQIAEDGRLALEYLARRYPEDWGRKDRLDIGGSGGKGRPDVEPLSEDGARKLAEMVMGLREEGGGDGED
jgi:transposase